MCADHHSLFTFQFGVVGRLPSVSVALPDHLLQYFVLHSEGSLIFLGNFIVKHIMWLEIIILEMTYFGHI